MGFGPLGYHRLGFRILVPNAFVESYAKHQQYPQDNHSDHTEDPIDGTFQNDKENYREKDQRGPLVPYSHVIAGVLDLVLLQLFEDIMVFKVVEDQQNNKSQFYVHPRLLQQNGLDGQQQNCEKSAQYGRGPGYDKP